MRFGLLVSNATGVAVENNTITRSHGAGISVQYAKGTIVRGNKVSGTIKAGQYAEAGAAIHLERDTGTVGTGNTLTGNAGPAISTYPEQLEGQRQHDLLNTKIAVCHETPPQPVGESP